MANVKDIIIHPVELYSEVAFCIAHCIGADCDNDRQIADTITKEEIEDCISLIRDRMRKKI